MRVNYIPPSQAEFDQLFQKGGSIDDIRTYEVPYNYHQRGSGIFSILNGIARLTLPFLKRIILPSVGEFSSNVINDYSSGVPIKESLKKRGVHAAKSIGKRIMKGGGRRRMKKNKKKSRKCRKKISDKSKRTDIFGM